MLKFLAETIFWILVRFTLAKVLLTSAIERFYATGIFNWEAVKDPLTFALLFVFLAFIISPFVQKSAPVIQQFPKEMVDELRRQNDLKERELKQQLDALKTLMNYKKEEV